MYRLAVTTAKRMFQLKSQGIITRHCFQNVSALLKLPDHRLKYLSNAQFSHLDFKIIFSAVLTSSWKQISFISLTLLVLEDGLSRSTLV